MNIELAVTMSPSRRIRHRENPDHIRATIRCISSSQLFSGRHGVVSVTRLKRYAMPMP